MWTEIWQWLSSYRFLVIGIASFFIPLLFSFWSRCNLGTKLSKGEVRKSIVIALTVMYIILLSLLFAGTADMPATNVTYSNRTIVNSTSNTTTSENSTIQTIPATVNIIQNFLYVYVVIIGFYFGSRLGERIKMLKELKNLKSRDILQKRYAMGEIDSDTFNSTNNELNQRNLEERFARGEMRFEEFRKINKEFNKQILISRYTRGKIGPDEFEEMNKKIDKQYNEK